MKPTVQTAKSSAEAEVTPLVSVALPAPYGTRWNAHRKAEVVTAVLGGILSLDEACTRYALSVEEFLSWRRLVVCPGNDGPPRMRAHAARARHEDRLAGV